MFIYHTNREEKK